MFAVERSSGSAAPMLASAHPCPRPREGRRDRPRRSPGLDRCREHDGVSGVCDDEPHQQRVDEDLVAAPISFDASSIRRDPARGSRPFSTAKG